MAVYKQKNSNRWWYKFSWNGELIRRSSKQTNKRVAEQMEAALKTALAKGEVGIREKKRIPTLKEFAENDFLPFVESHFKEKPKTLEYYRNGAKNLMRAECLAKEKLERITAEMVGRYVAERRAAGLKVASINRELEVLRRMLRLAIEWGKIDRALLRVPMLPGEKRRDQVLTGDEEKAYLDGANQIAQEIEQEYQQALVGIRATKRGEQPWKPDSFLLRDVVTVLLDCGLRPEECFRLRWADIRDGSVYVLHGKTENARRVIPMTPRVVATIEMRRTTASGEWVFSASTQTGHVEKSTVRKQHKKACTLGGIAAFPLYTFRHTCLTRWAVHMDPYTLAYLAGHRDFSTTKRYVHPQAPTILQAMERARESAHGHRISHSKEKAENTAPAPNALTINELKELSGRGEWIRTTDLLVPNQAL